MSQQKLDLQLKGLYTSPNNLSAIPQGALEVANNVVIDKPNIVESRRGQTQYGDPLDVGSGQVNKIFNYASSLILNYDSKMAYDAGNGAWTDYPGTYVAPSNDFKMRSLEALRNFYFTTDGGIYKIDALNATPRRAGVVQALSGTATLTGTNGFLVADSAVAYRLVWGYRDANNNLLLGAPSQRLVVANATANPVDVILSFIIPDTITTEYFYQIYRSFGTGAATDEPDDELQLVLQGNPTAGEIAAKSFTVTDITPYSLMRATIYTAPSQEGIQNANNEPPFALDMDVFKGSAFYANITQKQNLTLTMIAVGSPALGFAAVQGDTTDTNSQITGISNAASVIIQDLTYLADAAGPNGNEISITYIGGGTAGSEVVTVTGSSITVKIQDGVSTATQVKAAVDASVPASALISVSISGTGSDPQVLQVITSLSGGYDTSLLRVGMKVVGSGIQTGSLVLSIDSISAVTLTKAATATASNVNLEFQDRFSIGGVDYWAGSSTNVSINQFLTDTSGTPAQNINATALNLIQVINTSASNTTLYGYYISALEDLPGQILFRERSVGGAQFNANSTAGAYFSPVLPNSHIITSNTIANPTVVTSLAHGLTTGDHITIYGSNSVPLINGDYAVTVINANTFSVAVNVTVAGTTGFWIKTSSLVSSQNDARQNRVMISKPGQVEAVPVYTFFDIGSANFPIQRVVALRDGIFFFKQDGIYRLSGETFSSFTVALVDNTVTLKVPESAVAFNNQVYGFFTQGICAVTDSGVQILSVPIESTLLELSSEQFTNFASASFGVAYESSRQYMFFTVTQEDDEFATQAFIYNSLTKTWTRWVMDRTCGVVNTAINKLFMAQSDTGQVLIERKTFTAQDYADEQFPITITGVTSLTEFTVFDSTLIEVGMTLVQGPAVFVITGVDGLNITISDTSVLLEVGPATVYTPIETSIQYSPIDAENPGILKQFSELSLFFRNAAFNEIEATFSSNISTDEEIVMIENKSIRGWGEIPWGDLPWGEGETGQAVLRTYVPRNAQRCSWLTLSLKTKQAFTGFSLQGVSLMFNPMTSRIR